jgi:hypothetical protein
MPLTDFFRINLPYGIKKNASGEWFAFNREYVPLGWNTAADGHFDENTYPDYPVYTKYKGLTENAILKIVTNPDRIQRNIAGEIESVFFYNDKTNPRINSQYWNDYFKIIKAFSEFEISRV